LIGTANTRAAEVHRFNLGKLPAILKIFNEWSWCKAVVSETFSW